MVDLEASFLNAAGLDPLERSQGVTQIPAWTNASKSVRDHCRVEFRPAQGPFKQETFIEDRYKLVHYDTRDYGELYDLVEDPRQTRNLFNDPDYRDLRSSLEAKYLKPKNENDLVRQRMAVA